MEKQIKSKKRVADHGEVFTAEREVNAMLDLVKNETERIDSRFLEPACGDGNFLEAILKRKLAVVKTSYKPIQGNCEDYERNAIKAIMSIYGVDLLQDNVIACRKRLFDVFYKEYKSVCKSKVSEGVCETAKFVFSKNILCGNALTLKRVDENANDLEEPIIFAEWSFIDGGKVKRRDFRLDVLMKEHEDESMYDTQLSLFGDTADSADLWEIDPVTKEPIPKPIKEYPIIHYRRIAEYE